MAKNEAPWAKVIGFLERNTEAAQLFIRTLKGAGLGPRMYKLLLIVTLALGIFLGAPADAAGASFTDVASTAGLANTNDGDSGQVAWSDLNNDGYPDIVFTGPNAGSHRVYLNSSGGTFSASTNIGSGGRAIRLGDYDNDGDRDIVVSANQVYYNNGDGTFTENTGDGLANANAEGYAWLDYNKDGYLDIIHPDGTTFDANLWQNNGNGTFTEQTSQAGLPTSGLANGEWVTVGDYDADGDVDIFYGMGQGAPNQVHLWKNDGDSTFTNVGSIMGNYDYRAGFCLGDYDNDGDFDLFAADANVNHLLRTNSDGTFTDVTSSSGDLNTVNLSSYGTAWGDFDNDGDLDLYVNNSGAADSLFLSNGSGSFTESAAASGITNNTTADVTGVAAADYDLDGDLDIFVNNDNTPAAILYRNNTNGTNYLKVRVVGKGPGGSPKDGTGCVVKLYDSNGTVLRASREVSGGNALGQDEPIVHFGLASGWGGGTGTYTVKVFFTSGNVVTKSNIVPSTSSITIGATTLNQTVQVVEDAGWRTSDAGTWGFRKQIIIDRTKVSGSSNLIDFPMLISSTDVDLKTTGNGGRVTNSSGYDIIFTSSDGTTKLNHEIERYTASSGEFISWVKIPILSPAADTIIYMYFGNSSITTSQENKTGVWSSNFSMVYHLKEAAGTTGAGSVSDSTGNTSGTPTSGITFGSGGKVGTTADFTSGTGITTGSLGSPLLTATTTISYWIYSNNVGTPNRQNPFNQAYGGWGTMTLEPGGDITWYFGSNGGDGDPYGWYNSGGGLVTAGSWIYVVGVRNPTGYTYNWYKNGAFFSGSTYSSTYPVINTLTFTIGEGYTNPINGKLDEFRVSNTARSSGWIATEFNNQNSPSTFYGLGATVSKPGWRTGDAGTWGYRKLITIDHTKVSGTGTLLNFPLLISSTDADLETTGNGGKVTNSSGYDIIFTDSNGTTKLNHEIERYTASSGEFITWVKIPVVYKTTDTTFYMYFGNSSISTSQENITGVWDSNYIGAWHMHNASSPATDSTSNANNGTQSGGVTFGATGKINSATSYDGVDDGVVIANEEFDSNNQFETTQGASQWNYLRRSSGGTLTNLVLYSAGNYWTADGNVPADPNEWLSMESSYWHPGGSGSYHEVNLKWTATRSGSITTTAIFQDADNSCGDGIRFLTTKNSTDLTDNSYANGFSQQTVTANTTVTQGDIIYFRLHPKDTNNWCDYTTHDMRVAYTDLPRSSLTGITSGDNYTVSVWMKSATGGTTVILTDNYNFKLYLAGGVPKLKYSTGTLTGTSISLNEWHLLSIAYNGSTVSMSIDGAPISSASATVNTNFPGLRIGGKFSTVSDFFSGSIDDVRVSNIARSADWIATEYNNQSSPSTFYSLGTTTVETVATVASVSWYGSGLVQANTSNAGAASSSITAFTSNNTAGNLIVVEIDYNNATRTVQSITDTRGNTYTKIFGPITWGSGSTNISYLYYAKNIAAGANSVTVTLSGASTSWFETYIHEYSGIDTASPLDTSSSGTGASAGTANSGSITTASSNEVLFGYNISCGRADNDGTGWTTRTNFNSNLIEDKIASSAGSYSYTSTSNDCWIAGIAAFKTAGGGGYNYRKSIVIDHTKTGTLLNFPLLISSTNDDLKTTGNGGKVTNSSGYDIIFTASDGITKLNHEIEKYTASSGEYIAWVRIPAISSATDTTIYMYFGNSSISSSQENKKGVWDGDYAGVWHLPNGTTLSAADSTSKENNGTINLATATATDKMDGAASFGGSAYVSIGTYTLTQYTMGFCAKLSSSSGWTTFIGSDGVGGFEFDKDSGTYRINAYTNSQLLSTFELTLDTWYHIQLVVDAVGTKLYINGTLDNSNASQPSISSLPLAMGRWLTSQYLVGGMDEVRISSIARSADWIATEYNNQSSPSTFYNLGATVQQTPPTANWYQTGLVQANASQTGAASSAITAFTSNNTAGDLIVLQVDYDDATKTVQSVTDTRGNTYTKIFGPIIWGSGSNWVSYLYYAKNIAAGANSVTVTLSGASTSFIETFIHEYSGIDTASPLDTSSSGTGASAGTTSSGSITTASSNELLFGYTIGCWRADTTGWMPRSFFNSNLTEDKIASSAGSYSYNSIANNCWVSGIAAFKTAGGGGYNYRKLITIDYTKVSGSTLNFPLLISLTDNDLKTTGNGGKVTNSSGYDIIFTASDGITKLNHEIERYTASSGELIAWVMIPIVSSVENTTFYIYYGNSSISTAQENKKGVWDCDYRGVWHLPNGTSLTANDSTQRDNNCTISGSGAITGQVDGGGSFNGSSNYITKTSPSGLPEGNLATVSAWIKPSGYPDTTYNGVVSWGPRSCNGTSFLAAIQNTGRLVLAQWCYDFVPSSGAAATLNVWNYATWVINGTQASVYLNGSLAASGTPSGTAGSIVSGVLNIGCTDNTGRFFQGNIDEVHISRIARSAAWIATEYNNQSSPSTFYGLGSAEQESTSSFFLLFE